jgi:hypothetical protein
MASLECSCVRLGPNMAMIVSSEKAQTNAARPAALVRMLGRVGRVKVCPTTDPAGPT